MTAPTKNYVEFILDQLAALRAVKCGPFFGGMGLTLDRTQFAMLMGNSLYFVVDEVTRPKYEKLGSHCFSYQTKKGRVDVKRYYLVPANLIDDPEQLVALARESIGVASSSGVSAKRRSARPSAKRRR